MASQDQTTILNWVDPKDTSGEFKRQVSSFRNWISKEPGAEFPAETDRYHLYIAYACPWAHRTLLVRHLKGLHDIIPYTAVHGHLGEKGWRFATAEEQVPEDRITPDPLHPGYTHLRDIYFQVEPEYAGRFTVPTLYDKKQHKIVSNESSEIIRMFYHAFDDLLPEETKKIDLLPEALRADIESTNSWIYDDINNGVYKSGFATTQEAYERNVTTLFASLERVEKHLAASPGPYFYGASITEADIRLYTTIVRFDPVYVQHFKCNLKDIRSGFPAIHRWLRRLYWDHAAFKDTTRFGYIKAHYTKSHKQISPFSITPLGPIPDILPPDREVDAAEAVKASL